MHIFITGGTRGIGNGLVREFLIRGHLVSFTGTSQKNIDNSIKELNGDYKAYVCDVRNRKSIIDAMNQAVDSFGNIDVWINNAGVSQSKLDVSELNEEEIKRIVDINVLGTISGTSIALNQMKKQGYGIVYNLEGLGSNDMVIPKTVIYGSTKRLITYFCKGCNKELKDDKRISVGTISPGMVFTDLLMNDMDEESLKVAKILGNDVSYVAPIIVNGILKGQKKIKVLTTIKIIWRFMTSMFRKK